MGKSLIETQLDMLGLPVEDIITGLKGTVTSICFDLYGCAQCAVNPGLDKDSRPLESYWFDTKRLKVTGERKMAAPNFNVPVGTEVGPAEKPRSMRSRP